MVPTYIYRPYWYIMGYNPHAVRLLPTDDRAIYRLYQLLSCELAYVHPLRTAVCTLYSSI